jgi:hypothetical protein
MSRGLGTLQRAIIEALDTHQAILATIHADPLAGRRHYHVEDLRAVVVRRLGGDAREGYTRSFEAAMSRALRTLGARGLIRYEPHLTSGLVFVAHDPDKR